MKHRIFDFLREGALSNAPPGNINFVRRAGGVSYGAGRLFDRAANIATESGLCDLPPGTPVGLMMRSQELQVLFYLACLSAGVAPALLTPFNARLSRGVYDESLSSALKDSLLQVVISDREIPGLDSAQSPDVRVHSLVSYRLKRTSSGFEESILQFSSGTTGLKKAVCISHSALLAQLNSYGRQIGIAKDDHVVSWLPLYHDMGLIAALTLPLYSGASITLIDTFDWLTSPALFVTEAATRRATLSWNPNFFYSFMAERVPDSVLEGMDLTSLRGLVNCSEPVTLQSQDRFRARFAKCGLRSNVFWGCYAMAETTFALTHIAEDDPEYRGPSTVTGVQTASVGRALPGAVIRIVDERARELGEGAVGRIVVSSPFNFSGYAGDTSAARAPAGEFATGDLGYRIGDRYFVTGRQNDVVIVNGENIFPHQVEEAVGLLPAVISGRVAALGVFDPKMQSERLTILVEPTGSTADAELVGTIRSLVAKVFFLTSVDVHLVERGSLIKSSSGKLSRSRNREWWLSERAKLQ